MSRKPTRIEAAIHVIMERVGRMHRIGEERYREACPCPECRAWRTAKAVEERIVQEESDEGRRLS